MKFSATPQLAWPKAGMGAQTFLKRHWQKRPFLFRQAITGMQPFIDPAGLCQLAEDESVESRLITGFRGRWRLQQGPFHADDLPSLSRKRWTLLVQGVDLHLEPAHALLKAFRFLPDARLDDLMISLASDQGGVGPHVDAYDVFLLQLWGRRQWRIAPPGDDRLQPGLPLKILERFEPTGQWLLEPGDMLYLPPGWGHDGIADGPCMTASIGFRAPSRQEFLREFLTAAADACDGRDPRFGDPGRQAARSHPARLPEDLARTLTAWARSWRPDDRQVRHFIGEYLTEPKPSVWFESRPTPSAAKFRREAARRGLRLDRRSRILYRRETIFINGESLGVEGPTRVWLQRLADRRAASPEDCAAVNELDECIETLRNWFAFGWLHYG